MNRNKLRWLSDIFNQISQIKNRTSETKLAEILQETENEILKLIELDVEDSDVYIWIKQTGITDLALICELLSLLDVTKAPFVSSFWSFCGLSIENKENYPERAKEAMFNVAAKLLNCNKAFKKIYDEAEIYYKESRIDWDEEHVRSAAIRKMQKAFLACLWQVWRKAEDLPVAGMRSNNKDGEPLWRPEDFVQ